MHRLLIYLLLFLHLNIFKIPIICTFVFGTFSHLALRRYKTFKVRSTNMDVFVTACCCSLIPTPSSSDVKAHNLLQAHTTVFNLMLLSLLACSVFSSLDY